MSPLLVALLGTLIVPLWVTSWRAALFGLGCQGVLMAAIAYSLHPQLAAAGSWLELVDLALVRGLGVPCALYSLLNARGAPARQEVIPQNLLSWTMAFAIVLLSFSFAQTLVPEAGEQRTLVAVAASGVLLGFLVLATQSNPFRQVIGVLRIENAIALLELGSDHHALEFGVKLGKLAVFVATVALFRAHLLRADVGSGAIESGPEGPTL
jgi:hydrogenase-4 membrane subunit HyfE